MLKIGLTGGIGSGKSTVAGFFSNLGVPVIDSDGIARKVIDRASMVKQITERFGDRILDAAGQINRRLLRAIIFEDVVERKWLEKLLHPAILEDIQQEIMQLKDPYCVIVIPLLFEATEPYEIIDRILVVDISESVQIARTQARDQIPLALVEKMLASQVSRSERCRSADEIICNEGDLKALQGEVERMHQHYLQLAEGTKNKV